MDLYSRTEWWVERYVWRLQIIDYILVDKMDLDYSKVNKQN